MATFSDDVEKLSDKNETKAESENNEEKIDSVKKDVQQMLDEMMVETMKETEQQNEIDSDLSGTEKVEEVVIKDDSETKDKKDSENIVRNKRKPSDIETDTEIKKVSFVNIVNYSNVLD